MNQPILSDGEYCYRVNAEWAKFPPGYVIRDVPSVAVDHSDNVYLFSRNDHPVMVFDREGNFLRSWGEGQFVRPHGAQVGPDDSIYLTDDELHVVRKYDLSGRLLLTLGQEGTPSGFLSGRPFNRCTNVAIGPKGEIYVSDGYKNASVHKFDPDGRLLRSWGTPGYRPGEFSLPHDVACDRDGFVYVVDRENYRIQVFDGDGNFEGQWTDIFRPLGVCVVEGKDTKRFFVAGGAPSTGPVSDWRGLGPYISVLDENGQCLARLGSGKPSPEPGGFISPHGIAVDSQENIYVGEVARNSWRKYFSTPLPDDLKTFQKLEKVAMQVL
ncbi:peptidyl-alpha-hydroxyglycine alpha-amidating lyase family protein [Ensifer sp. YR511]|uniref:peptidyl-alpha-hydroxyglycine alpha-amidating lyase family protein n=1 Tax=Ensifer sp. YR511 TaxID=1855294 RepID=UPI00087FF3C1|nr:peptidyl-alpha-hydroxyglycine alpha-amidating lyase family protein [Ensifer sp. YR511]SDN76054.1 NHL repeat-containing protein [Ensifer sp. YR511]